MTETSKDAAPKRHPIGELEATGQTSARSDAWMLAAMVVCCATIPVALIIAVIAGVLDVGAVGAWSWILLAVAIAAATTMIVRVTRKPD